MNKLKKISIATAIILAITMAISAAVAPLSSGAFPPAGTEIVSYSHINVAPNPIGVGQVVTVNIFHDIPTLSSEGYVNMTVKVTDPDGHTETLGPFTSDTTGGTYTTYTPDKTGVWTFQMFYGGQTLSGGQIQMPDESEIKELVVQEEQVTREYYPAPPGPSNYWETPVSAMNAENWYDLMGPWLGLSGITFVRTGANYYGGNFNPYTESVKAGHVLWTKPWCIGGVAGGEAGPGQEDGHFWSTRQYWPQYAPVIMNGIMYSDWYTTTRAQSGHNGIVATDLYSGETLWTIDTDTENLRVGMQMAYHNLNQYGVVGPFIWTDGTHEGVNSRGTAYHMYDGMTGKYVCSVVNGSSMTTTVDDSGNIIGYFINSTDSENPTINKFNMTWAIGQRSGFGFTPAQNREYNFADGIVWTEPMITDVNGVTIDPALAINEVTDNAIVMTGGFTFNQGYGGTTNGWLVVGAVDTESGDKLWVKNFTSSDTDTLSPFTRTEMGIIDGLWINANMENFNVFAVDARTGQTAWTTSMRGDGGAEPNYYDIFNLRWSPGPGVSFFRGFGGDVWCINNTNGNVNWYTNTTKLVGAPGAENPYGVWPLWVFECDGITSDIAYLPIGHEYNPPMFPGAQMLAINITTGELVWSELGMYIRSTAIAYGIMLSLNGYDNQIYAFGRGPTSITVNAPATGINTAMPVTISGTITDVSPGASQSEVAKNYPNGLPCVSDASISHFMEHVYQDQPMPSDITGVPITLTVIDANGNMREIGHVTSDASGIWALNWTPDIPGDFKVIASFDGSESYWGSSAVAYFYASEAATPQPTTEAITGFATTSDLMTYLAVSVIAIIIAIAIVGLLLLRKRP
ncbi:MAG: PQQ-binding-like beta-propeller repeat protein [Candidatus Bathyarchaeia archaeon]|jgi:hypothetical protein